MNFIFNSPHFPKNFEHFVERLAGKGVTVLGIGSTPYDSLSDSLKQNLTEYYKVSNMGNYDEMVRACGYFTHKYGKIDRIESHNEHWMGLDAQLRTDFNVPGLKADELEPLRKKSSMKEVFRSVGLAVARGRIIGDYEDAQELIKEVGYPVCIKPDSGVGASDTHRIEDDEELKKFYITKKPDMDYICEEFIDGDIITYDGLSDQQGNTVFYSTLVYDKVVLDIVGDNTDMYYYIPREIPEDLRDVGEKCMKAFATKERFFHIEFFRQKDGSLVGLEINCRPPGYPTMDMFNFANDIDMYEQYANIVTENKFTAEAKRSNFCVYVSRKRYLRDYVHSIKDLWNDYGEYIVMAEDIPPVFHDVMGDYGIVVKVPEYDKMMEIIHYIWEVHSS